jgi:hypothetical protein
LDYGFFLKRAREAAGLVSQFEARLAKNPDDMSIRVNLASALHLSERAERELYDVAATEQIDVVRYRLVRHVSDDFLVQGVSRSLEAFQEAVSYVFDALKGQPRVKAGMTKQAKKESELLFGWSFAGSLGVVLLAPSERGLFFTRFDDVVQTINQIFDISDSFELRDAARKLGPAAVKKLYDWAETNHESGYDLDLRWTNSNRIESGRYLEARSFGRLADLISLTSDIVEDTLHVTGTLVGFDSVFKTFHFVEPGGNSYKGQLDNTFQTHQGWTVNRTYEAIIHSDITTRYSTGEETIKYRLGSLKSVDGSTAAP